MRLNLQDLGQLADGSSDEINRAIIIPAKDAFRQLRQAITGNLTLRDNQYAAVMTLGYAGNSTQTLFSGTEYTFQNPLKTGPIGFTPLVATNTVGVPIQLSGPPMLNTTRTDGLLGITADKRSEGPYLDLQTAAAQSITDSASTPITWGGTVVSDSYGIMTVASNGSGPASSKIVVSEPGIFHSSGHVTFAASVTGLRSCWANVNTAGAGNGSDNRGQIFSPSDTGDITSINFSFDVCLAANDYFEIFVVQTSGGNLSTRGNDAFRSRLQARRVGINPNSRPTMLLTGVLWGG